MCAGTRGIEFNPFGDPGSMHINTGCRAERTSQTKQIEAAIFRDTCVVCCKLVRVPVVLSYLTHQKIILDTTIIVKS